MMPTLWVYPLELHPQKFQSLDLCYWHELAAKNCSTHLQQNCNMFRVITYVVHKLNRLWIKHIQSKTLHDFKMQKEKHSWSIGQLWRQSSQSIQSSDHVLVSSRYSHVLFSKHFFSSRLDALHAGCKASSRSRVSLSSFPTIAQHPALSSVLVSHL